MAKAMEEGIMKAMEEDYSGGYEERNNEDYEGYNGGYEGRNNGGKTMMEAMAKTIEKDYGGGYEGWKIEEEYITK